MPYTRHLVSSTLPNSLIKHEPGTVPVVDNHASVSNASLLLREQGLDLLHVLPNISLTFGASQEKGGMEGWN